MTDGDGLRYSFTIDPFRRECLLKGLDDIGLTLLARGRHHGIRKETSPRSANERAPRREIPP